MKNVRNHDHRKDARKSISDGISHESGVFAIQGEFFVFANVFFWWTFGIFCARLSRVCALFSASPHYCPRDTYKTCVFLVFFALGIPGDSG